MAQNIQTCIERILQAVERHEWQSQHRDDESLEHSLRSVLCEAKQLAHAVQFDADYRTICRMRRGVYFRYHDAQWDLDHANRLWEIAQNNEDRTPVERLNALLNAYYHASQAGYFASQMCGTMGDVEHDATNLMIEVEEAVQAISNVEQTAEEVERDDQFNSAVKAVRDHFISTGSHLRLVEDDE